MNIKKPLTWEEWKAECNKLCEASLGFECFDEGDPYDCNEEGRNRFEIGTPPRYFIFLYFDEDIASKEFDKHLERESKDLL